MNNFIDIDYLVDSMEELCSVSPVTVEQANGCKSTIIWGLNQSYQTLQHSSLNERQEYIRRINAVMSMYQYPSLLVYTRFNEFPYLFDTINVMDDRLASMSQIMTPEDLYNMIFIKNIDNNLSDSIIRLINYMDNLLSDISFDVLYQQDSKILDLALVGLSQLLPSSISEYIFNTMYNDYECDLLTECDYSSVLNQYESKFEDPPIEVMNKFYEHNDIVLSGSRDLMFRVWKDAFTTGDPISKDLIRKGLRGFGTAFTTNLSKYTIISNNEQENMIDDYVDQMYVECSDAILRNYLNTLFRHAREEVLRSVKDDMKISIFSYIVKTFRFVVKLGREVCKYDNFRRN